MEIPAITEEVLRDLTIYTRKRLNCFIKLTVKLGSAPSDITCGVPWPTWRSIDPNHPPTDEETNPAWDNTLVIQRKPRLILTRAPPPSIPRWNIIISKDRVLVLSPPNLNGDTQILLEVSTKRALILLECHIGPEENFYSNAHNFLHSSLNTATPDRNSLAWSIAAMHPWLHEYCRDELQMTTCLTTPSTLPISFEPGRRKTKTCTIYTDDPVWASHHPTPTT